MAKLEIENLPKMNGGEWIKYLEKAGESSGLKVISADRSYIRSKEGSWKIGKRVYFCTAKRFSRSYYMVRLSINLLEDEFYKSLQFYGSGLSKRKSDDAFYTLQDNLEKILKPSTLDGYKE